MILTITQANVGLDYCINNINSFIEDVEILLEKNKLDHIIIPIQFAMEELGKAKILLDKIKSCSSDKITISTEDGWLDHKKKVEIASHYIDIPNYQKEFIFDNSPEFFFPDFLAEEIINGEVDELKDKAKRGHSIRLESSFVYFDKETGEPKLGRGLPKEEVEEFLRILDDGLSKLKRDYL